MAARAVMVVEQVAVEVELAAKAVSILPRVVVVANEAFLACLEK